MHAAAEEQSVPFSGKPLRPGGDLWLELQHVQQRRGQMAQRLETGLLTLSGEAAARLSQHERQQIQSSELCGEGLGGRNADLRTSAREKPQARLAHECALGNV